jgi:hypothetical protein
VKETSDLLISELPHRWAKKNRINAYSESCANYQSSFVLEKLSWSLIITPHLTYRIDDLLFVQELSTDYGPSLFILVARPHEFSATGICE